MARHEVPALEDFLFLFFEPSETSQLAGKAFWERRHQRTADVDPPTSAQTAQAQFPPHGGGKIARADVAHFMATALTSASYIRESPALAY